MLRSGKVLLVYLGVLCIAVIIVEELYQTSGDQPRLLISFKSDANDSAKDSNKIQPLASGTDGQLTIHTLDYITSTLHNATTIFAENREVEKLTNILTNKNDHLDSVDHPVVNKSKINVEESYDDPYEQEQVRLKRSPYIFNEERERNRLKNVKQTSVKKIYAFVRQVALHNFRTCLYDKCVFVDNISDADAVMFSASSIRGHSMPLQNRTKGQRWLMYTYDPAVKDYALWRDDVRSNFNWTMTYQLDSDFPLIFGQLERRDLPDKNYDKIYDMKTNHTAWFVSHCQTWGRREDYVDRMKTLMPVDVFGGCSDRRCGVIHYKSSDRTLCLPMLTKQYKFYLAFENSFCKDYLTEKFFKLFQDVDVIPVVRGGFDYKKYLPSGVFIDAADFKSPEDLAKHLNQLAFNKTEYVKMLKRKNRWGERSTISLVCNVCEALHTSQNKISLIPNLQHKFNGKPSNCWAPRDLGP